MTDDDLDRAVERLLRPAGPETTCDAPYGAQGPSAEAEDLTLGLDARSTHGDDVRARGRA